MKPSKMKLDVLGRIRNTSVPYGHAFIPLFEAVVNSIHSTEERFGENVGKDGKVDVRIDRVSPEAPLPGMSGRPPIPEIGSITITDNGSGFNDENMESFSTADSTAKAEWGGKGVGRFTWLVVFHKARIESTTVGNGGRLERRSFRFTPSENGIEGYGSQPTAGTIETSVTLDGVQKRYVEALRMGAEAIAERLFEHCFNYFVLGRCPRIRVLDDGTDGPICVEINARMDEVNCGAPVPLLVGGHGLEVLHVERKFTAGRKHEAHLCGNRRVVESFGLTDHCDLSPEPYRNASGENVVHHAFVTGKALDVAVDSTRTRIDLPDGSPLLERAGALDLKTLRQLLGAQVDERLADVLRIEREENFERIETHIRTVQPEYGPLLRKKRDRLERVKWSPDKQRLDESLHRVHQELEAEVRSLQAAVEKRLSHDDTNLAEIAEELERVIFETNEVGQVNLVKYVIKRRAVLKLLAKMVSRYEGTVLEEQIHRTVFPMKKMGDEVALGEHNLWLVDDTLAFYDYLTSDLPMNDNQGVPAESARRPDILAVKRGEPYDHVAIVEFKRPERSDSNPVQQLVEYAQLLRKGGKVDVDNIPLPPIDISVRIDGFAVVSLTAGMRNRLELSDLQPVPREERWHGHHKNLNLSYEVLDFRAFIRRAEQRNRTFFLKLGLL